MGEAPVWKQRGFWISIAKYGFAISALSFALWKVDARAVWQSLLGIPPLLLLASFFFYNLSSVLSVARMRHYLAARGVRVRWGYALGLYYVGMFYNLVLPGSIGGDGYRVLALKSSTGLGALEGVRVMLAERANGLLLVIGSVLALLPFSGLYSLLTSGALPLGELFLPVAVVGLLVGYFVIGRKVTGESLKTSLIACVYSLGVLLTVAVSTAAVAWPHMGTELLFDYLLLFQLGTVLSILPVSVGGAGLRELMVMGGAAYTGIDPAEGVAVSLVWFAVYMLCSLQGLLVLPLMARLQAREEENVDGSAGNA